MPNSTTQSTLVSLRVPNALHAEISSLVAQTGAKRSEVMVRLMEESLAELRVDLDWEEFDRAVMRHANAMSTRNALREARAELGL